MLTVKTLWRLIKNVLKSFALKQIAFVVGRMLLAENMLPPTLFDNYYSHFNLFYGTIKLVLITQIQLYDEMTLSLANFKII